MASVNEVKLNRIQKLLKTLEQRDKPDETSPGSTKNDTLVACTTARSTISCLTETPSFVTEKSMTLRQGIRLYPKAIVWSVHLSMTLVMEGYTTILIPNLFALEPFRQQFGTPQADGKYEINAGWQSALVNGGLVGQIFGLFAAGTLSEKIGYRRTLMVGLVAISLAIFVPYYAKTKVVLLAVYAADVCPVALRAYLTTYVNACWVLGQLMAAIVLRGMISNTTSVWSYRIPFALQWIFPVPISIAVWYAPESPYWLVRQDRIPDARYALHRLRKRSSNETEEEHHYWTCDTIEKMVETDRKEKKLQSGTRYWDCFKGIDRRRTEIACMCWTIQTLCGGSIMGFSTYFFEQAGLSSRHAFTLSLGQFALGLVGVIISWALMVYFGRRTLYLSGQALMFMILLLIGILACVPQKHTTIKASPAPGAIASSASKTANVHPSALNWVIASLLLIFTLTYDATVGPICYSLVSEIPSTRLRSKTIVLPRNSYNISGIITLFITPRMLNSTAWGWGAKAGFVWAATSLVGIAWSWWRLPEPNGRTYDDLDELFERKIPARKFRTTGLLEKSTEQEGRQD
ncbi:hypothetical protein N0V83_003401 [Neocucurbitaria cava]|uniref:Major facilitator superfamily (MFS) profile domain-containing protein n=1 Tax=Neocucurbitaria cava TaxID=798079 RepID=A0A9W9CP92_9PLEO|nr:hypothetical protein N0V83_003401 [Neocucurbitaria cava]